MAFSDYRKYTATKLRQLFQVEIKYKENLFDHFIPSGQTYAELQSVVMNMSARLRFSKFDNEATRGNLLVAQIL